MTKRSLLAAAIATLSLFLLYKKEESTNFIFYGYDAQFLIYVGITLIALFVLHVEMRNRK